MTDRLTDDDLRRMRTRAEAATPGPWGASSQRGKPGHCFAAQVFDACGTTIVRVDATEDARAATATADHIAAANPRDVLRLIAEVDRIRDVRRRGFPAVPGDRELTDDELARLALLCELEAAKARAVAAEREVEAVVHAIPGPRFMDPPDGGDVSVAEQVRRMAEAMAAAEREAEESAADAGQVVGAILAHLPEAGLAAAQEFPVADVVQGIKRASDALAAALAVVQAAKDWAADTVVGNPGADARLAAAIAAYEKREGDGDDAH